MEPQDLNEPLRMDPSADTAAVSARRASPGALQGRVYALFEILLCAGIATTLAAQFIFVVLGIAVGNILTDPKLTVAFLLLESGLLLALIVLLQRVRDESLWELGVITECYAREIKIGLAVVPVLFLVNFLVTQLFQQFWPQWLSTQNPLLELVRSPEDLVLFLCASLLAGGIKEEVQRAFILQRFKKYLFAAATGVILWSAFFGAGHIVQGVDSALCAGIFGVIFGVLYFWRKSLIAPVVAHAAYDVVVLVGYWYWGMEKTL